MKKRLYSIPALFIGLTLLAGCGSEASSDMTTILNPATIMDSYSAPAPEESSTPDSESGQLSGENAGQPQASSKPGTPPQGNSAVSSEPEKPKTVRVTIPEGYSAAQIFTLLEKKGVCSASELFDTINSYDFSYYPQVAAIGKTGTGNRCFKLEGYLYPNTYDFYLDSKPQDAIGVMLRGSQSKITAAYSGFSLDETVTVASLIEREVSDPAQMPKVASVIYNRLNQRMKLQIDATIVYVERYIKPYISGDINRYNADYNTNKCPDLPAGPICNPGANALNAALHPAQTNYLYFVTAKDGTCYFAETYEEHQANCEKAGISPSTTL